MCPYCGEEVPQDSSKCWKCGTELSEGASRAEGEELEVPDDDDDEDAPKGQVVVECPFCGTPVPKKSLRCRECGRMVQRLKSNAAQAALWKWGVWAAVIVVAIGGAVGVVLYAQKRSLAAERASRMINADFDRLVQRIQPTNKGFKEERRREVWEKEFERRFVHWNDGVVVWFDAEAHTVKIARQKDGKPDLLVTFMKDEDLSHLQLNEKIEYSARLIGYGQDDFAFVLTDGMLDRKP
jgi:hypothetical protein